MALRPRMPLEPHFSALVSRTRTMPTVLRYASTIAMVLAIGLFRRWAEPVLIGSDPLLIFILAVLLAAALCDHGCGLLAVALTALLDAWLFMKPVDRLLLERGADLVTLGLYVSVGCILAVTVECLHRALAGQKQANAELARSERARTLLLQEFRHRTRNDLGSLVGLLHLRARAAPSEAVREGLREAAQHAMALARVHTRLAAAESEDAAQVDMREFVLGLCTDLDGLYAAEGLRPIALIGEAEAHVLDTERAVQLGLVLNETVTNALKYAFPEGRAGQVRVRFRREAGEFVLSVADDGIGLPPEADLDHAPPSPPPLGAGLGTRLLRALAAQLRGSFTRQPGRTGSGTEAELRFPVLSPVAVPRA